MPKVFISIGSNIDKAANIHSALHELAAQFAPMDISRVYESEPVGFHGDTFYNLVVGFETDTDVQSLAGLLNAIEQRHGRERNGKRFSSRTLDLDLLVYGDLVLHADGLDIPRQEIDKFAFVLQPLAEIAPYEQHPENKQSYSELWRGFNKNGQRLWPIAFNTGL